MDISIIITYYSGLNIIKSCVNRLLDSLNDNVYSYEIIIVNDNPNINLADQFILFPKIKIINHEKNGGHPMACNTGAKYATGEFLIFMDCDIFVSKHWLESLLKIYETIPNAGAVSSTILDMATNKIHMTGIAIHQVDMLKILRGADLNELTETYGTYDFLSSGCIMIPKTIFNKVDGFDIKFFNSDGDLDLTYRISLLGFQLVTSYKSLVYHKGRVAGTMRNLSVNDTKALFFKKWGNQLPDGLIQLEQLYTKFQAVNKVSKKYLLINLSKSLFVKDYFEIIENCLKIEFIQIYNFKQYANNEYVSLVDFINDNIIHYNVPIIFFSDNYRCILNNSYWFAQRSSFDDLTIDIHGNISYVKELCL